jgi:uncharacterized protein YcbX
VTGSAGPVGAVLGLTRYPVKSMAGEALAEARVDGRGLAGDRRWAVYTDDGGIGSGKTTRRFRRVDGLLRFGATAAGPVPAVGFPTGERLPADDPSTARLLSEALGRSLALRPEDGVPHHDESAVHVITTGALRRLGERLGGPVDPARFRANVLLDTDHERIGDGRELRIGAEVVLRPGPGMPRCVMVDLPQGDLDRDGRILKALGEAGDPTFGLQASVVRGGTIRCGDPAVLR